MADDDEDRTKANYETFRECLAEIVIEHLAPAAAPKRKRRLPNGRRSQVKVEVTQAKEPKSNDAEDLGEFIEYLAWEIFPSFPVPLQSLSYASIRKDPTLDAAYSPPIPASTIEHVASLLQPTTLDSLTTYGLLPTISDTLDTLDIHRLLTPLLTAYTNTATTAPSSVPMTRATACELCERDWIPLTYHHLIPRAVHAKVLKRGWHEEWRLNSVAWLCRACHSFVHKIASNEELAREWWSVELLAGREDVQMFAKWVGGVRWKSR